MKATDRITGKNRFNIFDQLIKDRTILKLNIFGADYEGLTIVIDIKKDGKPPSFLIDYPGGGRNAVRDALGKKVLFEFSGKDRIQYYFKARISEVSKDQIRVSIPEEIERIQRRKSFRTATPHGTRVVFDSIIDQFNLNVINVSEGGMLINHKALYHNKDVFYKGGVLEGLKLICDEDSLKTRINIDKAEIVRVEKIANTGRYNYALKFKDIEKNKSDELRGFIYECQRFALKKRSYFGSS